MRKPITVSLHNLVLPELDVFFPLRPSTLTQHTEGMLFWASLVFFKTSSAIIKLRLERIFNLSLAAMVRLPDGP
jgi:hypothetical protein